MAVPALAWMDFRPDLLRWRSDPPVVIMHCPGSVPIFILFSLIHEFL